MRITRKNLSGVTLLELIIAMALVAIAFTGIYNAFSGWLSASFDTESHGRALHLAHDKIEEVALRAYADISSETRAAVTEFPAFEREVRVSELTGIKTIEVEVFWRTGDRDQSYRLHTERVNL